MQDYKIRIPNVDVSRQVQDKAFELGYGRNRYLTNNPQECNHIYLYADQTEPSWGTTAEHFRNHANPEISYQDFLRLVEPITTNNTTIEIMSEITLKCIAEPQKAKNITVSRDYTGILIDSDDSQVDTLRDAKFFRCVNNNGIEAKYKLSLFAPIEPPAPPRPQFPTWEQIESGIYVNDDKEVILDFNDEEHIIYDNEALDTVDLACCGIKEVDGIQSLYENINRNCVLSLLERGSNPTDLKNLVFKKIVENKICETRGAFKIFTITSGHNDIENLMQEILTERGGIQSEYRVNPNSSNNIKVFVINV